MSTPRLLEVDGLAFRYGSNTVLADVRLSLGVGTTVLLGRNGAGKTTLIRILAGAVAPAQGVARFADDSIGTPGAGGRRLLRRIGWLPQDFGFPPHMTCHQFVSYAAWLKELPKRRIEEAVSEVLDLVGMAEQRHKKLRALSGGQVRRVGLAAAVVADPDVLILDEPTAGLDPEQRDSFHALIRKVHGEKVVLVATHLLEDAEVLAHRIVVLDAGRVRWQGTPEALAELGGAAPGIQGLRSGFQAVLARA